MKRFPLPFTLSPGHLVTLSSSFTFGVLLLTLSGCAVKQKQEVQVYRKVLDARMPATAPYADEPLTLARALQLANQTNESLARSGEDYLQALIDRDRAAASFLPTISLAPSYALQDKAGGSGNGGGGGGNDTHRLDVPANGQANLFNGFRDVANYKRAGFTIAQRKALLLDLQESILLDVAQTYYQVLRSERSVGVLQNSLTLQEQRLADVRGQQQAGLARPLDVSQSQADAAATRTSLIQARSDVRNGRTLLGFLIGRPLGTIPLADHLAVPEQVAAMKQLLQWAARDRQDIRAAESAVEAARQQVEVALGAYYPSLTLDVNAYLYRESLPTDSAWNALLSARIPIFQAGLIRADVRTAWSQLRQAMLDAALARRQSAQQVRTAYENFTASAQTLAALATQVQAAQAALQQAEASYRVGLATNLERLTAQNTLLSAQLQQASAAYDQKVFYLDLLRATGRLSVMPDQTALAPPASPATQPTGRM
jgi:outer membrane protein